MLARQRRRWQLGMTQTLIRNHDMIFNPAYGNTGLISMPFHLFMEVCGCVIEAFGTLVLIPVSLIVLKTPQPIFFLFLFLAVAYGTLLSMGSVVMEEITLRRYPRLKDVMILMAFAMLENIGYRQIVTFFKAYGVLQSIGRRRQWEHVEHKGLRVQPVGGD
jgi:hypothetical protein